MEDEDDTVMVYSIQQLRNYNSLFHRAYQSKSTETTKTNKVCANPSAP
jgi:hypothetical protein